MKYVIDATEYSKDMINIFITNVLVKDSILTLLYID